MDLGEYLFHRVITGAFRAPETGYYPETGLDEGESPGSVLSALAGPLRPARRIQAQA